MTINGGITSTGGSGPIGGPFEITWNAIEDNHINGGVNISGYDGFRRPRRSGTRRARRTASPAR
jgi:hypothetical protein